jgi:competence protein ComEC
LPRQGEVADGAIACTDAACTLRLRGASTVLVRGAPDAHACDAPLLISAEPLRLDCGDNAQKIDRFSVWRDGAFAAWLDAGGVRVLSDRADRGVRPWVRLGPEQTRVPPDLPPAKAEELPPEP